MIIGVVAHANGFFIQFCFAVARNRIIKPPPPLSVTPSCCYCCLDYAFLLLSTVCFLYIYLIFIKNKQIALFLSRFCCAPSRACVLVRPSVPHTRRAPVCTRHSSSVGRLPCQSRVLAVYTPPAMDQWSAVRPVVLPECVTVRWFLPAKRRPTSSLTVLVCHLPTDRCHVPLHTDLQGLQPAGGVRGQATQFLEFGAWRDTQVCQESRGIVAGRQSPTWIAQGKWHQSLQISEISLI